MATSETPEQFRGWLMKWTNYLKGYQKRWFVLSNGLLSYYRTQEEMAHSCRGSVNLAGAYIDTIDSCNFVVTNGPNQVFHLRAQNEVERQRWVTALELAKQRAINALESDESDEESVAGDGSHAALLPSLKSKLQEVQTSHESLLKNSNALLKSLTDLDSGHHRAVTHAKEKLTAAKLTASSFTKLASEFTLQAESTEKAWEKALRREMDKREMILDNMESMAKDMVIESPGLQTKEPPASKKNGSKMEPPTPGKVVRFDPEEFIDGKAAEKRVEMLPTPSSPFEEEDEEDFEDAVSEFATSPEGTLEHQQSWGTTEVGQDRGHKRMVSTGSILEGHSGALAVTGLEEVPQLPAAGLILDNRMNTPTGPVPSFKVNNAPTIAKRRETIPEKPQNRLNLWSIMKNCIGKDLSKIPLPVNFNEPLSFIQRFMEDLTYVDLLSQAATCSSSLERMAYVCAFSISSYASASYRVGKPFNPLLGETYELDRRAELGWRAFCEQVSHHPPACAQHAEHEEWTLLQDFTMTSKFRGAYLHILPNGVAHLAMHRSGDHYTWGRVSTTIYNIIVGRLWVDQSGELEIINHTTGDKCVMKWNPYSYFSRERQRKVSGTIMDKNGTPHYAVHGYWDECMGYAKVTDSSGKHIKTGPFTEIWRTPPMTPGCEKRYHFSPFTCTLNEMEEGVAPTDSRFRPDQRVMEECDFDKANTEKVRLEEKQRAKRRAREAAAKAAAEAAARGDESQARTLEAEASYNPQWFQKQFDPCTNTMVNVYKGGYWEAKQKKQFPPLPDLF